MQLMIINRTLNCVSITQDGWTPLITAAFWGKCDVVLDLLDSGADVNAQSNVSHCHLRLEPFPADIPWYVPGRKRARDLAGHAVFNGFTW